MSTKISQLTAATTPTGPESVPIVQSGTTVKATISQIVQTSVPTLTASTSVVTPSVITPTIDGGAGSLNIRAAGNLVAIASTAGGGGLYPGTGTSQLGGTGSVWVSLTCPVIDSGTTGNLALRLNNGDTILELKRNGVAGNWFQFLSGVAGNGNAIFTVVGSDTNISPICATKGSGAWDFRTDFAIFNVTQFKILHTAQSSNYITVTGSNGGNPTLSTSAGNLAITPIITAANKIYPGTDGAAAQTASGLYAGTGAPNNANGNNGDIYFRSDGGALTTIYQRRAGAWVGVV